MKYIICCWLTALYTLLPAFSVTGGNYHEQQTQELREYLNMLIKSFRTSRVPPDKLAMSSMIRWLVENGADPNVANSFGDNPTKTSAIHYAAEAGDIDLVKFLVQRGVKIETRDDSANTPLQWAVRKGHTQLIPDFISLGTHIESKFKDELTLLMCAAAYGQRDGVVKLLEAGVEVNEVDRDGSSALLFASSNGHHHVVAELLTRGADIGSATKLGRTSLMHAAQNGHDETVRTLLHWGADLEARSADNSTALIVASFKDKTSVVETLLVAGASVEATNNGQESSLMLAARSDFDKTMLKLLEFGASISASQRSQLLARAKGTSKDILLSFLSRESYLAEEPSIHREIRLSDIHVLKQKFHALPNDMRTILVNLENAFSLTPLNIALLSRNEEAILFLLKQGANPLNGRIHNLRLASRVLEWQTKRPTKNHASFFDEIYEFSEYPYLIELALASNETPIEVLKIVIRWMLAPWTVDSH